MQAMRQGGPVIEVSCQDGAVCFLCVGGVRAREPSSGPPPHASWRVAHIKGPDETNAGGNGLGRVPGRGEEEGRSGSALT